MPQTVEIPGIGSVDFPDGMTPEQMHAEATKLVAQAPVGINNLSSPAAQPSLLGQLGQAFTPASMLGVVDRTATGVLNSPTMLVNQFRDPTNQYELPFQSSSSVLPQEVWNFLRAQLGGSYTPPGMTNAPVQGNPVITGLANSATRNLEGFTTPGNVALLPVASEEMVGQAIAPLIKSLFGAMMGQQVAQQAPEALKTVRDKNAPLQQKVESVADTVIPGLLVGALAREGLKSEPKVDNTQVANETTGTQYKALLNPPQERGNANTIPQSQQPIQLGNSSTVLDTLRRVQQQLNDLNPQPPKEVTQANAEEKVQEKRDVLNTLKQPSPPVSDYDRYNQLTQQARDFIKQGRLDDVVGVQKEIEQIKNRQPRKGMPPEPPTQQQNKVGAPEIPKSYQESEAAQGRKDYVLETPLALNDQKVSGFSPEARPDAKQLLGRLENMGQKGAISPSEVQYFKEQGLEEFLKNKPTVREVGKWMQENGPRVEVRKFGKKDLIQTPEQRRLAQIQHELDTMGYGVPDSSGHTTRSDNKVVKVTDLHERSTERKLMEEYQQLWPKVRSYGREQENASHWQSIAPKDESKMPGYVEVSINKPGKIVFEHEGHRNLGKQNPIGFGRGYMETLPDGKKVFHVVEVQSDWAQQAREAKERFRTQNMSDIPQHLRQVYLKGGSEEPLLHHYEPLVLKALIQHAREQGASHIALSDAETAMMTEGHDRAAREYQVDEGEPGSRELKIPQEPGMRLHYDRTLPKALENLTGGKGERVEFGEHKMAVDQNAEHDARQWRPALTAEEVAREVEKNRIRKDLIFRNPDSTPKTSISARMYPLDKVKAQPPTVFNKRYSPDSEVPSLRENTTSPEPFPHPTTFADAVRLNPEAKSLGLVDGMTGHDLMQNIIKNPDYDEHNRALAGFLSEHFEHVLRMVPVEQSRGNFFDLGRGESARKPGVIELDASGHYNTPLEQRALHEAVHAATEWASEFPSTATQRAAVDSLNELLKKGTDSLPANLGKFVEEKFRPIYDEMRFGRKNMLDLYEALDKEGISSAWLPRLYAMTTRGEMLAQMFSDRSVFDWLNRDADKGYVQRVWDGIKDLLGVKRGSIVDQALDTMRELGAERNTDPENWYQPQTRLFDALEGKLMPGSPALQTDIGKERSTKEAIEASLAKWAGRSAPTTLKASRDVGNALVRYASARITAPQLGEAMASGVLADKFKDPAFNEKLGNTLIQDRLNALRAMHEKNGETELAEKVSNVLTPDEFKKNLADKDIKAAIERHKNSVQLDLERMHRFLGGKISVPGKDTGAFVNLIAMLNPDDVEAAKGFIYGSRKGDVTNPLKKGSAFGKKATGTAEEYNPSYRAMVERAYRGNYEEYAKQKMYQAYEKAGLGVEEKPGVKPPTFGGKPAVKIPIDRRGGKASNLWVRSDLAPELRQALQTDSPVSKGALLHLADVATELQVMGPTDFVFHMGNMLAALKWSQGSGSPMWDLARKMPLVSFADTAGRLAKSMRDVWQADPATQRELAELAMIGAGRAEARHSGLVTTGLEKAGLSKETANKFDPNYYTSRLIKFMDKSGRLTANRMFDNLVEQGWAKDTEENRRDFINRMGQYNERLMTQTQQWMRERSISPFVTAGRTFNRLAMQRLLQSPGFEATSPQAAAKARLVETLGTASVMFALPIAWNLYVTGKPFGNAGIPNMGALDLGKKDKDGKEMYFDLLQGNLLRRALRITGAQALDKDLKQGDSLGRTSTDVAKAIVSGIATPWDGPIVKSAMIATTGKDYSSGTGFLVSRNPDNTGENLKAALMNLNPTVASLFGSEDKGAKNAALRLAQVGGLKAGAQPTFEERADAIAQQRYGKNFQALSTGEKAQAERVLQSQQQPRNELQERASGERAYWEGVQRKDDLVSRMKPEVVKFINDNKLKLPGFEDTQRIDKENVPLTNAERKKFEAIVAQKYESMTEKLMSNPDFASRSQVAKQATYSKSMSLARRQAWAEFRRTKMQHRVPVAP